MEMFRALEDKAVRLYTEEDEHEFRKKFERDRDRILYSKAFRRLSGKTQVFITGYDDHHRTRLTHSLEVAQIARTISKRLKLNEDLTEAIALGHDIGHTPFGHVGERTLNSIMNGSENIKKFNSEDVLESNSRGFKHNHQGVYVVQKLERIDKKYRGLNLTNYTMWGIGNHSSLTLKECNMCLQESEKEENKCVYMLNKKRDCSKNKSSALSYYDKYFEKLPSQDCWTFEALIVNYADEIAQRHHDVEDGLEAGILKKKELLEKFESIFNSQLNDDEKIFLEEIKKEKNKKYYMPMFSKLIVNFLVNKIIENIQNIFEEIKEKYKIYSIEMFYEKRKEILQHYTLKKLAKYTDDFEKSEKKFHKFLKNRILNSALTQRMDGKGNYIIRQLFKAYVTNPQQLPDETIFNFYNKSYLENHEATRIIGEFEKSGSISKEWLIGDLRNELVEDHKKSEKEYKKKMLRTICNYIAGMTDQYVYNQFQELYGISK